MSMDDTGKSVWELQRPPLAMLVAVKATEVFAAELPEEKSAPLRALSEALLGWWPKRKRDPEDIYKNEFAACLDVLDENEPALQGAYLQLAGLLKAKSRSLPADRYYEMDENDFVKLLRDAAKVSKLPVAQLESRLKLLIEHQKEKWPDLIGRADRMRWARGAAWSKLDKRVRALAAFADLGAKSSWCDVGGQQALRLELDGTKRIAMLDAEELEALRRVIPAIAAGPA